MLKALLQLLLSKFWSKQENAALSTLGYSSEQYTTYNNNGSNKFTLVMPFDGEVVALIRSTEVNQYLNIRYGGDFVFENRSVTVFQLLSARCYCEKGRSVEIEFSTPNVSFDSIRLYKNVGNT